MEREEGSCRHPWEPSSFPWAPRSINQRSKMPGVELSALHLDEDRLLNSWSCSGASGGDAGGSGFCPQCCEAVSAERGARRRATQLGRGSRGLRPGLSLSKLRHVVSANDFCRSKPSTQQPFYFVMRILASEELAVKLPFGLLWINLRNFGNAT